jgi:hypothetical protein
MMEVHHLSAYERMERISDLLLEQSENKRSRGVLLRLCRSFAKVKGERERYHRQANGELTLRWADGYLSATASAIDLYLEARFKIFHTSQIELEQIVARDQLSKLFHEPPAPSA